LSVQHRHPLGLNTMCSRKRAHSSKNSHSAIMKINQSKGLGCRKAACGCYGPRTATYASWHMTPKNVVFSLIGSTQCCLSLRSYSLSAYLFPKTYPVMTNKSQIKWSAGLRKRDLADDEDQRADLRVYPFPSLPYLDLASSSCRNFRLKSSRIPDLSVAQAEAKT